MASKSSKGSKAPARPKIDREKRRMRAMSYIFLGISVILILSMLLSAIAR